MKKLKFHTTSILIILCLFCIGIAVLLWRQVYLHSKADKKESIQRAIRHHNNLVFSLEQHTIRTLEGADAVLRLAKNEIERFGMNTPLNHIINTGLNDLNLFEGLAITDSTGKVINTYPEKLNDRLLKLSDRQHFLIHKHHPDTFYISTPLMSKSINQPVIVISRRISGNDGSFLGTIAIQLHPSTFMAFYKEASLNDHDILSLISPEGITYARRTGMNESSGEDISKSPLFRHVKRQPVGSYFAEDAIQGIPTYFSYRKLRDYPIIATVGSSESDILSNYQQRKRREFAFGMAVSTLLLGFGLYIFITLRQRRKDINTLIDSESKYRSIFEGSQDAIFLLSASGRIQDLNQSAINLFRLKDQPRGEMFTRIFKYDQSFEDFQHSCFSGCEVQFDRLDHTAFIGEISLSLFYDALQQQHVLLLIRDVSQRKQMEKHLEMEQKRHQLELTKHIITAQEKERELIGKELHDNINQVLTTVKLYLETAVADKSVKEELITRSIQHILNCIQEIRSLSHSLSAPTLGTHSLVDSIQSLAENLQAFQLFSIHFNTEHFTKPISKDQSLALYRIAQEQFTNIIKHANATEVQVHLEQNEESTTLTIKDNGKGFQTFNSAKGIGINNMTSRAKAFHGSFNIYSIPAAGCTLTVSLPLEDPQVVKESWS